jgi:hypothetical protein
MEADMYFDSPGKDQTAQALKLAFERGKALGLNEVVVASTKGDTAYLALERFEGFRITVVTYHSGFKEPFKNAMPQNVRRDLESKVSRVVAASHALSGIERSIAQKHSGIYPALLIAEVLRLFGQGTKVAVEIAVMAADAGALSGNDIISIGGTGRGADTALVVRPAHQNNFFDLRIREVICKPRSF